MNKRTDFSQPDVLDEETLQLLSTDTRPVDLSNDQLTSMRKRLMQRIDEEKSFDNDGYITIRPDDGAWSEITPKIEKKILHIDPQSNTESFLLRIQPGAEYPSHIHLRDEHCLMLEGEIEIGNIEGSLKAGDYHFAPRGSRHGTVTSVAGALLLIQTGQDSIIAAAM